MTDHKEQYLDIINKSIENHTFIKITLSKNIGNEPDLKNIYVKPVSLKTEEKLSFTFRYKTKDITKNYSVDEAIGKLNLYINVNYFTIVNLITVDKNYNLTFTKNGKCEIITSKATHNEIVNKKHDIEKTRKIQSKSDFLQELKITDVNGEVFKNAQDKYKQINHYIELLAPLINALPKKENLKIMDMGSGKGYLTFALYEYLNNQIKVNSKIVGIEFRSDLVKLCNEIAINSKFSNLSFIEGTILDFDATNTNILIALHACDTATDDAIFKGILANANLIVVAPCCHKQIRREMEKGKAKNELNFLIDHGIFMERQAEMVTDGLRALILEYYGYTVKIQQFISDAHTPKNIMITAIRNSEPKKQKFELRKKAILEQIKVTKAYFGIQNHYLETLLDF